MFYFSQFPECRKRERRLKCSLRILQTWAQLLSCPKKFVFNVPDMFFLNLNLNLNLLLIYLSFFLCLIYLWPRQELKRRKTVSWLNFPDCEVLKSINYIQIKYLQLLLYFYFLREYFLLSLVSVYRLSIIFFFINI